MASTKQISRLLIQQVRSKSTVASEGRFFPKTSADSLLSRQRQSSSTSREQTAPAAYNKIAFLGAGNMAQAILNPVIRTGLQPASQIAIHDPNPDQMSAVLADNPGVKTAGSIRELIQDADLVICAVKPQNISAALLQEIRDAPNRPKHGTFLSVIAGVPLDAYKPAGYDKIVRSMPNTPAMIGRGMTVWCATDSLNNNERDRIDNVLSCLGETMYVDSENQVDMSTAISGSGPAYIFGLMEDMVDAGVHMGFPRDKATTLVYHTLLGSTLYAMETGEHPAILRNNVTSPNGTTASAIYELENGGFRTAVKDAMWACYRRSLEMGGHESNVGPGRSTAGGVVSTERMLEQMLERNNKNTNYRMTLERKSDSDSDDESWAA